MTIEIIGLIFFMLIAGYVDAVFDKATNYQYQFYRIRIFQVYFNDPRSENTNSLTSINARNKKIGDASIIIFPDR